MRTNRREFAAEQEATPGSAETIVVADLLVRMRDGDSWDLDVDIFDPEELQASSSKRPIMAGRSLVDATISYILRGPASQSVAPAIQDLLLAAMLEVEAVTNSPIGAVTTGPFLDGETITGGTSTETATVFRDTANGAAVIKYIDPSGAFDAAEVLTGGTSGATATTGGAPAANGFRYKPADSNFGAGDSLHHVTGKFLEDGTFLTGRGMLANLSMLFQVGKPVIVTQRLVGGYEAHGDLALFAPATYPEEDNAAPLFLSAALLLGGYTPTDIREMTMTIETNPEAREDAQSASGVLYADYQKDAPTLTVDPAKVLAATKDWLAELRAGTRFGVQWNVGTVAGLIWSFFADDCQLVNVDNGSERSLATRPLEIRMGGTSNDELIIWQH
jgi:hypothetical protein